jgi:hypothetical protein
MSCQFQRFIHPHLGILVASLAPTFERLENCFQADQSATGLGSAANQVFEGDSYMPTLGRFTKQTQFLEYFKQCLSD